MGGYGPPQVTYVPTRRHTYRSEVRLTALPARVRGVSGSLEAGVSPIDVSTKDGDGLLVPDALPVVTITKYSRYTQRTIGSTVDPDGEVEIFARIASNLAEAPLAGFVCEGMSPFAMSDPAANAALAVAIFSGMPVVRVGRGNTAGMAYKTDPIFIAGNNLTATKARMLLMAALLKLGALPPAENPCSPTADEMEATRAAVVAYQALFDSH
jgi:hypothetical protein